MLQQIENLNRTMHIVDRKNSKLEDGNSYCPPLFAISLKMNIWWMKKGEIGFIYF